MLGCSQDSTVAAFVRMHDSNKDRLNKLNLQSLEERRFVRDVAFSYNLING